MAAAAHHLCKSSKGLRPQLVIQACVSSAPPRFLLRLSLTRPLYPPASVWWCDSVFSLTRQHTASASLSRPLADTHRLPRRAFKPHERDIFDVGASPLSGFTAAWLWQRAANKTEKAGPIKNNELAVLQPVQTTAATHMMKDLKGFVWHLHLRAHGSPANRTIRYPSQTSEGKPSV